MSVARGLRAEPASRSPRMLLWPLMLLLLLDARLLPVEALNCYDCLSKALGECSDPSKTDKFDRLQCINGENFCSTLVLRDTAGNNLVSRQCASSPDDSKKLLAFIRPTHDKDLTVVHFKMCKTNLCNTFSLSGASSPSSASISLLTLALGAVAALRLCI